MNESQKRWAMKARRAATRQPQQKPEVRNPAEKPQVPSTTPANLRKAQRTFDRNKRLIEAGETFASQAKPAPRRRRREGLWG